MRKEFIKSEHINGSIAVSLLMLVLFIFFNAMVYIYISLLLLFVAATLPVLLYPLSFCWYNTALLLSKVASFILLTIVFICLIFPMGIIRRMLGKDSLKLRSFKRGGTSAFSEVTKRFEANDLTNPF